MWGLWLTVALAVDPGSDSGVRIDPVLCSVDPAQRWMLRRQEWGNLRGWRCVIETSSEAFSCLTSWTAPVDPQPCSAQLAALGKAAPRRVEELVSLVGLQHPEAATWVVDSVVVDWHPDKATAHPSPLRRKAEAVRWGPAP